jgi:hypothetical protein
MQRTALTIVAIFTEAGFPEHLFHALMPLPARVVRTPINARLRLGKEDDYITLFQSDSTSINIIITVTYTS